MIKDDQDPTTVILKLEQLNDVGAVATFLEESCNGYMCDKTEPNNINIPTEEGVSWQF